MGATEAALRARFECANGHIDADDEIALIASDELCPVDLMQRILDETSGITRAHWALVENRSTPETILTQLVKRFDTRTLRRWLDLAFVAHPHTSPDILLHLVESRALSDDSRLAVARRPITPPAALHHLVRQEDWPRLHQTVAEHPSCPPEILFEMVSQTEARFGGAADAAARNPSMPWDRIAATRDAYLRQFAAECDAAPAWLLTQLAKGSTLRVARCLAANPATPEDVLVGLYGRSNRLHSVLAANPALPLSVATLLVGSGDEYARWVVAGNPGCPPSILAALVSDSDGEVAAAALANKSTPVEAFVGLPQFGEEVCGDLDDDWVPGQPWTPPRLVPGEKQKEEAAEHPECPVDLLRLCVGSRSTGVRQAAARNPRLPSDCADQLAGDSSAAVRAALAWNPTLPDFLLVTLSGDESALVRRAVAERAGCPEPVLQSLAADPDSTVSLAVTKNSAATEEIRRLRQRTLEARRPPRTGRRLLPKAPPPTATSVDVNEAAFLLGVTPSMVYVLHRKGDLPTTTPPLRWPRDVVETLAASRPRRQTRPRKQ